MYLFHPINQSQYCGSTVPFIDFVHVPHNSYTVEVEIPSINDARWNSALWQLDIA